MNDTIVILGGSVRAAACSALAAGLRPYCADLFADADLAARAPVARAIPYPAGLVALGDAAPPGPWMYTGGLENHPDLVARISRGRPLYGNEADVLRAVRDPLAVLRCLSQAGLNVPECRPTSRGLPRDGSWLRKRRGSCGGRHVRLLTDDWPAPKNESAWYFQQRIAGLPCAAVYVAAAGEARLLGATEQLVRPRRAGHPPYCYAGSIGPLRSSGGTQAALEAVGRVLSREFGLCGLFGVDAVLAGETVWPVEVNPRYTASVEVLERASGLSAVGLHVAACRDGILPERTLNAGTTWFGKEILYANSDVEVSDRFTELALQHSIGVDKPEVADVPRSGTQIAAGHPVLTVFAQGDSRDAVRQRLSEPLHWWGRLLSADER